MSSGTQKKEIIKVLIVDDIPDTRENLRKLLAFEGDIEVVGVAGTGLEAIDIAKSVRPDVVLMDINMPDMDGITATKSISMAVPTAAVVIMSVQSEPDYLRQAMLAGARDFLTKPISSEELYTTIRRVYERNESVRRQQEQFQTLSTTPRREAARAVDLPTAVTRGAGHVIVVYSPQGGVGTTTIATNVAAALVRADTRVLLVDCDLQFGDVDAFLNLQPQSNISNLTSAVKDLDIEIIDNVLVTHGIGLKVLTAPSHPEQAYEILPQDVIELVETLAATYDYVVIDTPTSFDDLTLKLFEAAERILLVANPTIPTIRNIRKMLDIFDKLEDPAGLSEKIVFVLNRTVSEKDKGRGMVPIESIEKHLKRTVDGTIPLDERAVLSSVNQGVPLVAKMKSRSPGREMNDLAEKIRVLSESDSREVAQPAPPAGREADTRSKSGIRSLFGGT